MEQDLVLESSPETMDSGEESTKTIEEPIAVPPANPVSSTSSTENINVDVIFQRNRRDIMFELRRLQHGDRPVTGGEYRNAVENLFAARLGTNNRPEEQERPEEVRVEIQGLIQSRPVSGVLRSTGFRRRLESVVRNHFQPPTANSAATENSTENNNTTSTTNNNNNNNTNRFNIAPINEEAIPSYSETRREDLIMEISSLVHQQLVSSTLTSGFRESLEQHVQDRRERTATDGLRVQQAIRSLPPSNISRNDFSRYGIIDTNDNDSIESVSVINATAAVHVNNSKVNKEMAAMKLQIKELTNLVKQQIELQFETQRSIRQEVAAALALIQQSSNDTSRIASRPLTGSHCVICTEKEADCMLYRCGHICTCYFCGKQLEKCPVCRAKINEVVKAYKCSFDA